MYQRDYLMRLLEEMTTVLGRVMGMRQQNKITEALWEIDELLQRLFRLNGKLIGTLSPKDLIQMCTFNGVLETEKLQAIAVLLKEQALLL